MFLKQETKKMFIAIIACLFATICAMCGFYSLITKHAFAETETIQSPDYLVIASSTDNDRTFDNNSTVFLAQNENLNITLGKPATEIEYQDTDDGTKAKSFTEKNEIGDYALSFMEQSFSLKINDVQQNLGIFKSGDFLKFISYNLDGNKSTFTYLDLTIDLDAVYDENTNYFPTGKYVFSFNNYVEYSGTDFSVTNNYSFSITLYIFNTMDYFTTDSASSQNVSFLNVEQSNPTTVSHRNYYFFNYTNLNITGVSTTQNLLPQLQFDSSKFIVNISKSVAGTTYSCEISAFNSELVTLSSTTTTNFLSATYNENTKIITVNFKNIGEYVIDYQFVYNDNNTAVQLESEEILLNYEKNDLLTIFGYQMYYAGQVSDQTEFKALNEDKSATLTSADTTKNYSADITYLFSSTEKDYIKTDDTTNINDSKILEKIKTNNLQPVSTNQPTVLVDTNSILNKDYSCYYLLSDNEIPDTLPTKSEPFKNQSFTQSGTYLLKIVYTHSTYYNSSGKLSNTTYFVQYFYFKITTTTPSVTIVEKKDNGKTLHSNDYTKYETTVTLQGQSLFNREVTMQIYKKSFSNTSSYLPCLNSAINAEENPVSVNFNDEGHYCVQLTSGKNNSKTTYFTIDKTEISGINIIPVEKDDNNTYVKDQDETHYVNFFSSEKVVVEWKEKLSGAQTYAYYKYIPFSQNTNPIDYNNVNNNNKIHISLNIKGIVTTDSLSLDITNEYNKSSYSNNLNQVTPAQVFTNQGLYIFYIYDQAGHEQTFAFCIDKTEIQIMQYDTKTMEYDNVKGYNLVTRESTTIEWGDYKLIDLNCTKNDMDNIQDSWIKQFFQNNSNVENAKIVAIGQDLYFAVKINSTYALRTGTNLKFVDTSTGYDDISLILQTKDYTFANEMSYSYYFIDESNKYYNLISSLSTENFVEYADKTYQITTSSDASDANVFVNNATTINEFVLNTNSSALTQSGFADSYSSDELSDPDIRTKYYFATGSTYSSKVSMLAYKIKLNINDNLYVSKITMYYYPFIVNDDHDKTLSTNYTTSILYDATAINQTQPTALTGNGNEGYYAFNLNVGNYQSLTQYQTLPGKYIIVREYNSQNYDSYDFKIRESVFIVDREEIVSSPESVDDELISSVGNGVYISVLDGNTEAKQFTNIYSAKNNAQTYILQTNKLPVVVYIPIVKYGHQDNLTSFFKDDSLNYYLTTDENGNLIRLKDGDVSVTSKLKIINFGNVIQESFEKNYSNYASKDYNLTVKITSSNGTKITLTDNTFNYWQSSAITQTGTYDIEIIQNNLYGKEYPNVYNTFKFSFQILEVPPDFIYTDTSDTQNAGTINNDANGIYYTNIDDNIKVVWTDPADTTYFAKINYKPDNLGNTKIKYYITSPQGVSFQEKSIAYSNIETDGRTHWFYIDISNLQNNYVLNVYMEYERGTILGTSSEFERLTTITKHLYIDRYAPTEILDMLSEKTTIENINFASNTRKYVTTNASGEIVDVTKSTVNPYKYNITQTTGAYANYAYAVNNGSDNEFVSLLTNRKNTNTYITGGYYAYLSVINDITQYSTKDINTAISLAKTSQISANQTLVANNYYEVIEVDLAGNVAIYLIYVVDSTFNNAILTFDREKTNTEQNNSIIFENVDSTQDIYAKTFLNITNLNIYDYRFLEFSLDGKLYFKSSALLDTQCYVASSMTTATDLPSAVNIQSLLKFTAPSHHTLIINNSVSGQNYTFELYVDNKNLSYNLLTDNEGINIQSVSQSNIKHYLSSIKISSYNANTDKYVVIYNKTDTFSSSTEISASVVQNQSYTFTILSPELAYTYEFVDNYGVNYIEHHTAGSFVLNEDQKVKNYLDKITVLDNVDDEQISNEWYAGNSNIIYNYSSTDYYAYIKIYVLTQNEDKSYEWECINGSVDSTFGTLISSQASYITIDSVMYCSISTSPIHSSVKQLTLLAPTKNLFDNDFSGNAYRYEITLVNHYDNSADKVISHKILINNLTPIIDLKDKNDQSITSVDALYTEQISIIIPSLRNVDGLYTNTDVSKYLFNMQTYLVFENESTVLTSGTIVTASGQYKVNTYATINENNYLYATKTFIIADSPTAYYQVWVQDASTGELVLAQTTGKEYRYDSIVCYHHYIVNSDPQLFLNENQEIHATIVQKITSENITTTIYKISNLDYVNSYNISPYETSIAITKIEKTDSILSNFTYTLNNGDGKSFSGTNTNIIITQNEQNADTLTIKFKSYYGIPENYITAKYICGNNIGFINSETSTTNNSITEFNITNSGEYLLTFSDVAGNNQVFTDNNNIEMSYSYRILFVKGVPYLINGNTPIQNAIYNDKVEITVPAYLNNIYDSGGKPTIVVYKNNKQLENIKAENGIYTLKDDGYYTVYFTALVNGTELRKESYSFEIISSNAYMSSFSYTEYENYEIISVVKNNEDITAKLKRLYGLSSNDNLTSMTINLYDEKTGEGNYEATILTNSGLYSTQNNEIIPEQFTFTFVIKSPITIPITVSINEGTTTKDTIVINFNALDLYNDIGECTVVYGKQSLAINQEYLDTLNNNYFCSLKITESGTYYIQVYSSSNNLLYSYRVDKKDPLNAVSIILIVAGVGVAVALTISIVLLRKKMKIK